MNLSEIHDRCCKYLLVQKGNTQATVDTYRTNFREFCVWLDAEGLSVDISSVGDYDILERFMEHLYDKGLSRSTIRLRMISLNTFCKYLLRKEYIARNPFDRLEIPKRSKGRAKPLADDECEKLLSLVKRRAESSGSDRDIQAVVMLEFGAKVGLRKGAMQNIKWENIDFHEGYLYVLTKGQIEKCFPAAPSVLHWLKRLKLVRKDASGHVMLSPRSKTPISKTSLHDEFKRYVELAGLDPKKIHLHRLRHTYGTTLHNQGFDIRDIQVAMGHDDIGSTEIYVDVPKKELRTRINRVFSKPT